MPITGIPNSLCNLFALKITQEASSGISTPQDTYLRSQAKTGTSCQNGDGSSSAPAGGRLRRVLQERVGRRPGRPQEQGQCAFRRVPPRARPRPSPCQRLSGYEGACGARWLAAARRCPASIGCLGLFVPGPRRGLAVADWAAEVRRRRRVAVAAVPGFPQLTPHPSGARGQASLGVRSRPEGGTPGTPQHGPGDESEEGKGARSGGSGRLTCAGRRPLAAGGANRLRGSGAPGPVAAPPGRRGSPAARLTPDTPERQRVGRARAGAGHFSSVWPRPTVGGVGNFPQDVSAAPVPPQKKRMSLWRVWARP